MIYRRCCTTPSPFIFSHSLSLPSSSATSVHCMRTTAQSSGVKRNNFRRIEYLIHQGKKKLTMLEQSTMTSIRR